MFKTLIGDLFESRSQTLVNTVNCVGVMGKGVAAGFKHRYPDMFVDYVRRCERREVHLGRPYLFVEKSGTRIVNFPTKNHWRSPSRLEDIERGLDYLAAHVHPWSITSIALPPLGCGNGGLQWTAVGPLMFRKLSPLPIDVEVFAPFGTPKHQLTTEFLAAPSQLDLNSEGRKGVGLNASWIVLLEVIRGLQTQPYANPVGRVVFQKICYVLTEMGVPTGFQFERGSYGPFSDEVKLALHEFANRNWLREQQLGRMLALTVGEAYEAVRGKFVDEITKYDTEISKAIDLFSRIKNTDQAEEVVTVLFASRQLKQANDRSDVTEQELLDYVLTWKKGWNNPEKKEALAEAIRSLLLLRWIRLRVSESLIGAA